MKQKTSENLIYTFILFFVLIFATAATNSLMKMNNADCYIEVYGYSCEVSQPNCGGEKLDGDYYWCVAREFIKFIILLFLTFILIFFEVWLARGGIKKVYRFMIQNGRK